MLKTILAFLFLLQALFLYLHSIRRLGAQVDVAVIASIFLSAVGSVIWIFCYWIFRLINRSPLVYFSALCLVILLGGIEVMKRRSRRIDRGKSLIDHQSIQKYGKEFEEEYKSYYKSLKKNFANFDFSGERQNQGLISINNGRRVTTGQPKKVKRTIYILGGSTVFNAQVPDHLTITSLLQEQLNNRGTHFRVENFGWSGATSRNRLEFFQKENSYKPGDICILYFGVNDACYAMPFLDQKTNFVDLSIVLTNSIVNQFRRFELIASALPRLYKFGTKKAVKDSVSERTIRVIESHYQVIERSDLKFLAVLQPSAFNGTNLSPKDYRYLGGFKDSPKRALSLANKIFVKSLARRDYFLDGRNLFDANNVSVFTDWVHTSADGNRYVSNLIYNELERRSWLDFND